MGLIEDRIVVGNIEGAKSSIAKKYLAEDKADWNRVMQEEYDLLFPTKRGMTEEERNAYYDENYTDEVVETDEYPLVDILESEQPDGYKQFPDWLNETRVVTEAIEEVSHIEVIDDMETKVVDVEAVAEVTELVRPYVAKDVTDRVDAYIRQATTPSVVTMRQARLSLLQSGLLATVEGAITNGTDEAMKIEWEYATDVRRDWASLIALTGTLGMTAEQLDELFILAGSL